MDSEKNVKSSRGPDDQPACFREEMLKDFAAALFIAAGMPVDKAGIVAEVLVEADLLGHSTHGLALVPRYLDEIEKGRMEVHGDPVVLSDRGACVTWDGRRLPGTWLLRRALDLAVARVAELGMVSVALGNAHHMGCFAAFLSRVVERGLVVTIASSAPAVQAVSPFGGLGGVLSPAPFAVGFPTGGAPVLIDVSSSITTVNRARQLSEAGRNYDAPWLLEADGTPSIDPAVLDRGGSLLPVGGLDHGQKGYGWGLFVEAMSQGLSGQGRADAPSGMINAAFVQVIDPSAFAGLNAFTRQTSSIAERCRAARPRPGTDAVRLPGEAGLRRREEALRRGVPLSSDILKGLRAHSARLGIAIPDEMTAI